MDSMLLYLASVRWLHIGAGITWIGLLYYFNFVQAWAFPKMEAAARTNAMLTIHVRALLWFREDPEEHERRPYPATRTMVPCSRSSSGRRCVIPCSSTRSRAGSTPGARYSWV